MRSNPLALHVWFLVRPFVYFHTLCVRTATARVKLCACAVSLEPSLEPSLFAYGISTVSHELAHFIHVYSPRAGTDNILGTEFWCQQKFLITLPICCQFKKISLKSDFLPFLCVYMYIAPGRGRQPIQDKNFMITERPFLFAHMLQVSKWSLRNLILYKFLILYMYIAPG